MYRLKSGGKLDSNCLTRSTQGLTRCSDYLFFMPPDDSSIVNFQRIYSYYLSTVNVNPEGDVDLSFEINLKGIGR